MLRRWLTANGYDVAFIRNVTDIDDKILNKAADAGRPWWEWAATFERAFSAAYDALGVLPPSAEPRATGHITQMVELIERLIDKGHAYAAGGDVYFDVLSLPDYGQLSGHRIDDVHQGEGVATGKRDQRDFTLWKGAKPGEPSWPTPWGAAVPAGTPNASRCARPTWVPNSTSTQAAWIWCSRTTRTRSRRRTAQATASPGTGCTTAGSPWAARR